METINSLPTEPNNTFEKRTEELLTNTSFKGDLNFNNAKFKEFRDQLLELANSHNINDYNENPLISNITESSTISHKTPLQISTPGIDPQSDLQTKNSGGSF